MTGASICFSLAIVLYIQGRYLREFNNSLTLLAACLLTATVTLWMSLLDAAVTPSIAIVASNFLCTMSYCLAMLCAIKLYRSELSLRFAYALVAMACCSFLLYDDLRACYLWNQTCRIVAMAYTSLVILRSADPEAPELRRFALGLGSVSAVGMLPKWFAVYALPAGSLVKLVDASSDASKFQALLWAISPALVYACITSVAYSRIAYRFQQSAYTDELTGARNRRFLFERGEKILSKLEQSTADAQTSLLLIDIDHFKRINDSWGHATGDEVLKYCVSRIREVTRVQDSILSRYGGEEFCVLLPQTSQAVANEVAKRICAYIAASPFIKEGTAIPITVSIGLSESSELQASNEGLRRLLSMADKRLYRAKASGRNAVVAA